MTLEDEVNKCLLNLANSVKALRIATEQLKQAADKMSVITRKPNLKVIKNDSIADSLAKGVADIEE